MSNAVDDHLTEHELHAYLDEELSPRARRQVEEHVKSCGPCTARLERIGAVFALLDHAAEAELERDLRPAVLTRLARERQAASRLSQLVTLEALIGSVTLAVVAGLQLDAWSASTAAATARELAASIRDLEAELVLSSLRAGESVLLDFSSLAQSLPAWGPWPGAATYLWPALAAALMAWVLGNGLLLFGRRTRGSWLKRDNGEGYV